ncbi:hypothetical protein NVV94_00955 [Pseudomonas sp. LS1212]|uniref:hypothetical protein n=1 Tax=Pseudomonas sp. LS1212 TaxID=2972478 RepID=UPI00215C0FF5|nr:hypothetical protein [Pseudomonas sp. LS1212]UVJ44218.1 hypothetical protein NVV94_00955 [Pseudomonas sp. LS1212]
MRHDIKFISIFVILETFAIMFVGVYDVFDIILASVLGTLAAALISNRKKTRRLYYRGQAETTFLCSGILATLFSIIYNASLFLTLISISGSPFDVPFVSLLEIFLQCWVVVFLSTSCVIALFDWHVLKKRLPELE